MMRQWILSGHEPVEADSDTWLKWFEDASKRRVALDVVNGKLISTVFLGIDHNFSDEGPPLLFETMVFGGKTCEEEEGRCERYVTWDEALKGHQTLVAAEQEKEETRQKEER